MSQESPYSDIFNVVISNIKLFIIIGIVSIVCSVVFSSAFFITPKFKSDAILYPSNIQNYSSESASEQMLQFLEGNDIRDSIIAKFNLINHYEIDTTTDGFLFNLNREFYSNVDINKTSYESVSIQVLDKDPQISKAIVDEFIFQLNTKIRNLHREKSEEVAIIWKEQLDNKKTLIDTLEAQIKRYSVKYGLLDYAQQSREVTAGYMNMLLNSKRGAEMAKAEELYESLKAEGRHFQDLHHQLNLAREDYNKILINYEGALRDISKKLTYTNVVVFPEVADKKHTPVRWLIVTLSFLSSMLLAFVLLLFLNRLKK